MQNPLLDDSLLPRFDEVAPAHAEPALRELIAAHRRMLAALLDDPNARDFATLVAPLEEMSHELDRAWSPVSHLNNVLGEPAWRDAYNATLPMMTEHATELSHNKRLQQAYQQLADNMPDDATPAMRTLVEQELRDFRLAGVALPEADKARFKEVMQELAATKALFEQNVQDATDAWHHHATTEAEVSGLPAPILERAQEYAGEQGVEGWWLTLDFPTYNAVIMHADDRRLREVFYRAWSTRASDQGGHEQWDNSENIEKIMALRFEAARLVGFENYAEYSLATKMADEVDEVVEFLTHLAERTRPAAARELEDIASQAGAPYAAWDVNYFMEKLKQQRFAISDDELRRYFPADRVKSGLFHLAERLYGVTVTERQGVATWDETVRYFEIRDHDDRLLGSFFTDLYARTGKRGGAWMDECVVRKNLGHDTTPPVGYLVCNFSPPDADGVSLLTHNDVLTLFHEFGHMLHHLLTRVDFPSIAGINGVPWDAVELPSQFMENFAWCYDVLAQASAHVDTGEPLPRAMFDRLDDSRHFGQALSMLRQIEFALFDFRLHAEYDPSRGTRTLEIMDAVRQQVALVEQPSYNRMPHNFLHIFAGGYGAGYYSYKWAEVLAADAFAAFEEAGIFDRATATRFREEILEIGGSRDIMDAYVAFRGRKPTLDALLRHSGIGKAA